MTIPPICYVTMVQEDAFLYGFQNIETKHFHGYQYSSQDIQRRN